MDRKSNSAGSCCVHWIVSCDAQGLQSGAMASLEGLKVDAAAADKENGCAANVGGLPGGQTDGADTF